MTKRIFATFTALAALCGFVCASTPASETIMPTAITPAAVIYLAEVSSPVFLIAEPPAAVAAPSPAIQTAVPAFRNPGGFSKGFFEANLIAMVGLNVADYISTRQALKYPGLEEANPLMKPFVKNPAVFAAFKVGTTALTYWSFRTLFKRNRTVAWVLTTATNALLSVVVANNLNHIRQARAY